MALTLEQLQAQFSKEDNTNNNQSRPSNYYRFYDMNFDETATVRFLPDKNPNNPTGFMVEKLMHNLEINGERRSVPCNKMYGTTENCPVCNVSSAFYKEEGDKSENGKKYWRKKQHIAQVLVVEDPLAPNPETGENCEGKVMYINIGYQLYSVIKEGIKSGDLKANPIEYENGYDFVIKKSKGQGGNPKYDIGSKFARDPRALTEDEIAFVESEMIDLSTLIPPRYDDEKLESMLTASLTGEHYDDGSGAGAATSAPVTATEAAPAATVAAQPAAETTAPAAATPAAEGVASDQEYAAKGQDVLEMIKARKAAQAQ